MSSGLRLCVLAVALFIILVVFIILKRGRIPVKYSLVWFLSAIVMILVAIFPNFLVIIASMLGFNTMSNLVIGFMIIILLFISLALTIIVSGQNVKIKLLIQEISMLKSEKRGK